ncbi:MAG: hypothetical protein WBA12_05360, partial [Catalinimonas sp.]
MLSEWPAAARRALAYLRFRRRAGDAHGLHSPFVFRLYTEVLAADKVYYAFDDVEALRARLERDSRTLRV